MPAKSAAPASNAVIRPSLNTVDQLPSNGLNRMAYLRSISHPLSRHVIDWRARALDWPTLFVGLELGPAPRTVRRSADGRVPSGAVLLLEQEDVIERQGPPVLDPFPGLPALPVGHGT